MQIILLSGGSGQRLWPMSNGKRAKQFLKLFTAPDGSRESMMQRMMRQMQTAGLTGDFTVVTSDDQRDIIASQFGQNVDVVIEPSRRGTYPALALAAARLALDRQLPDDEVVVAMPCDVYAETAYFATINTIAAAVKSGEATLAMIGLTPSSPSSKYGYIITAKDEAESSSLRSVLRFVEKPGPQQAEKLVYEGARWNAGVFAFRLGYLKKHLAKRLDMTSRETFEVGFEQLPHTSFDYEVAECETKAKMKPFNGMWRDIGTWDTLTAEIPACVLGNARVAADCKGSHVFNELDIPVLCLGMPDAVVAASPDGILVAGLKACDDVENHLEGLAVRPMYEERRWGTYKVVCKDTFPDGHQILTKELCITAGHGISYQRHHHRDEVWTFVDGTGRLVVDGVERTVGRGDVVNIRRESLHAVRAVTDLTLIEVQSGDQLVEEDIDRFPYEWD